MKILFASTSSGSQGGGELYLVYLARALVARGHVVGLFVNTHARMDELVAKFAPLGEVVRFDFTNTYDYRLRSAQHLLTATKIARGIAARWDAFGADVVHINKQNLEDGLDCLRAADFCTVPTVATLHMTQTAKYLGAELAGIRDFASRRFLRRYRGQLITIAENRKRDLLQLVGRRANVVNIDNGVRIIAEDELEKRRTAMRAELGISESDWLVVSVGRLEEQKRPELFFELAAEMSRTEPKVRLVWVGEGRMRSEMEGLIAERGLPNVVITGWTDRVLDYLAAADGCVHMADYEGLPFSLLEAMAAGVPCFVRSALLGDLPFRENVDLFEFRSAGELVVLLDEETDLRRVAASGRKRIAADYSVDAMAEKYEEVYRACLK